MPLSRRSWPVVLGASAVVVLAGFFGLQTQEANPNSASDGVIPDCPLDTLPVQASDTVNDILAGGPYKFPENDNQRFGNYEGHLPEHKLGYYREYTVLTPGINHRGERRIITGGGLKQWYYTPDHYETFCTIPNLSQ